MAFNDYPHRNSENLKLTNDHKKLYKRAKIHYFNETDMKISDNEKMYRREYCHKKLCQMLRYVLCGWCEDVPCYGYELSDIEHDILHKYIKTNMHMIEIYGCSKWAHKALASLAVGKVVDIRIGVQWIGGVKIIYIERIKLIFKNLIKFLNFLEYYYKILELLQPEMTE